MATEGKHVIRVLFFLCPVISLLSWGVLAKNLEEQGENYFSSLA